jgi:hypothetical protein
MCRPTSCRACSRTTWAGCGQHANQVMAHVPPQERCVCTPAEREAARGSGFLARLFKR